ncbi:MAG: ATP-dependent DNA helicase RecG, partial [Candidatus Puniceispirillum sp.]|nr:ATP-dependent DNA helicase RecG [Candidatus Puniceispirillum sp.]
GELELVFFHAHSDYVAKQLPVGARRIVSGRVDLFQGRVQMAHPDHIVAPENSDSMPLLEPIYPLTAGLTPKILRRTLTDALTRLPDLPEWIPEAILSTQKWPGFADAMRAVHAPQSEADLLPTSPARARLAFDELLANQLALIMVRQQAGDSAPGRSFTTSGKLVGALKDSLAFDMTAAQHRAISEITADQVAPKRMLRMLQGDVGSGKTLVALAAMLTAVESGAQAALLAPTEVLARQHHASLSALLQPLQIEVGLLLGQGRTSAQKPDASQQNQAEPPPTQRSRKATLAAMADGTLSLVVGTHALLSDTAVFKDLGVAVIDEQHRFGVRQRILLGEKGRNVDVMVMTATPIPRSLAMTAYGDLDHSQLDEKPVGRLPIDTRVIAGERLDDIVDGLRRALGDGKRAYWICPLVDESDQLDIAAAEARFASLSHALPGISVALAHGKMKAAERDSAMQDFRTGRAQLLVATTVVEVGVDVPEASIIVIEHAERFGLAQLHQLRGRVGRSSTQSSCLLVYYPPLSETASKRLSVMRETNDGFVIAEEDLSLRGPGEFLGQRQSGVPEFVLADLAVHRDLLAMARTEAHTMLAANASSDINLLLCLFERDSAVKFLAAG